jgi:hypothetical protein
VTEIAGKLLKEGIKAPPSVAFLQQLAQRLGCSFSNARKDQILDRMASLKGMAQNKTEWSAEVKAKKNDKNSQICRLINIIFSKLMYPQYAVLKDKITVTQMNYKVNSQSRANAFWNDVAVEYTLSELNDTYDTLHYDPGQHEWFEHVDPSNCWALTGKECKTKWGELRKEYQ